MGRWLFLLGGLVVWTIHFLGVYAIGSVADLRGPQEHGLWRSVLVAFSLACGGAVIGLGVRAGLLMLVGDATHRFSNRVAAMGCAVGLVAIVFQTLPALIG